LRRLILECSLGELGRYLGAKSELEHLESFEVIKLLKEEPNEWAMICKLKLKQPRMGFEKIMRDKSAQIQPLQVEKDGSQILFMRHKPNRLATGLFATGGFLSIPLEISGGKIRASFLGSTSQLKKLLRLIDHEGIHCRIASNSDANFSQDSPLGFLTEKQRKVITSAYNLGYYDIPKKVSSEELASRLHIREATFVRHRIKAEKRLLGSLLAGS